MTEIVSPLPPENVTIDSGLSLAGKLPADTTETQENAKTTNNTITIFFIVAPSCFCITVKESNRYIV
jgi:hypothetical protein